MSEYDLIEKSLANKDTPRDGRFDAIDYLGDLGDMRAVPLLLELLEAEEGLKASAALSLGKLRVNEIIPQLMVLIRDPENRRLKSNYIHAISYLDCQEYYLEFATIYCEGNLECSVRADKILIEQVKKVDLPTLKAAQLLLKNRRARLKQEMKTTRDNELIICFFAT